VKFKTNKEEKNQSKGQWLDIISSERMLVAIPLLYILLIGQE